MANQYRIEFGFDMGEAKLGQIANMQWGMAESADNGATWQHFDPRKEIAQNCDVAVWIFNMSDPSGQLNAVVDGGVISSIKATDAPGKQEATKPWSAVPPLRGGTPRAGLNSAGLNLDDLPGMRLCNFTASIQGHFAITVEVYVDGHDYTFKQDPELVVGGPSGL